ncbi:hypothetical protein QN355_11675 [Cryobacterium sp. 10S3]|uniref:hypothetical protein n=1 Tax=Cryobacterium sp. 10S3 TaxID=3048582 RepID=UPI002AC9A412|nr:hypothetical protein [Cryobacterium sp. 10S3]MEB0287213.1 hypothetical protein [Cryobacterium sp. 10S3]WPX14168.1 hypothetical protein RHM57_01995 [Cryobacterium sp. 10S3]
MIPLPAKIFKHWFGYVIIAVASASLLGLLYVGFASMVDAGVADPQLLFMIYLIAVLSIITITIVQTWVYSLSYIELNSDGIVIKNWFTLFVSKEEKFEWVRVSRSTAAKGGIFGQVLNYGTISIETNGGSVQAKIIMIPRPEYWQDQINLKADQATSDGSV